MCFDICEKVATDQVRKKMSTVKIVLLLSIVYVSQQQQDNGTCSDVQLKLEALSEAVQTLCGSSTASPSVATLPPPAVQCDCASPINWTSVTRTRVGSTSSQATGTLAYDIPSVIPNSAKEVLILASVVIGNSGPSGRHHYIKIYTQQGSQQFEKYIYIRTYGQSAYNTNSDNLWFPMTTGRQVFVELTVAHTGSVHVYLDAIGYR